MASEWRTATVRDVTVRVTKGTTPTTVGRQFVERGINFVKVESITDDGRIEPDKLAHIDERTNALLSRSVLEKDDVLFTIAGTIGRVALVPSSILPANTNQAVAIVRPRQEAVLPRFLYYVLGDENRVRQAHTRVVQSVQANFSLAELSSLEIPLPKVEEQRAIAHILGTLDDKIELNRRMNETLEAMARALFRSWFVDFDPVRDKAEGHDPGLPKPLADLFPDSFEAAEPIETPEGWSATPLYDIATYINGAAYAAFQPNDERSGLPIIKIAELKAGVTAQTKFSDVQMPEKYRVARRDILFSWSGNPDTSIDVFVWSFGPAWLNQHIFRVVPHHQHERAFVLATLKSLRPVFAEIARNKQTTGLGHVTAADMKRLLVPRPDDRLMRAWQVVAGPLLERAFQNEVEIHELAAVRDTLLPKLISGELRVKDAGRFVEAPV